MEQEKDTNLIQDLSIPGKIFFAAMASYVLGKNTNGSYMKIKGSPEEMKALADAMAATKSLMDEINNPSTTIETVIEKMSQKRIAADHFEEIIGKKWPL